MPSLMAGAGATVAGWLLAGDLDDEPRQRHEGNKGGEQRLRDAQLAEPVARRPKHLHSDGRCRTGKQQRHSNDQDYQHALIIGAATDLHVRRTPLTPLDDREWVAGAAVAL